MDNAMHPGQMRSQMTLLFACIGTHVALEFGVHAAFVFDVLVQVEFVLVPLPAVVRAVKHVF